jgi:hypothetical protein
MSALFVKSLSATFDNQRHITQFKQRGKEGELPRGSLSSLVRLAHWAGAALWWQTGCNCFVSVGPQGMERGCEHKIYIIIYTNKAISFKLFFLWASGRLGVAKGII